MGGLHRWCWRGQSVTARSTLGSGSPLTRRRWCIARSKASRTAFRTQEERASVSLIPSRVSLIPKGASLDLGSHCQLRLLSKKRTRKSFSADLNCIRSPALRTSSGGGGSDGWGSSAPLRGRAVLRALGSMI